MENTIQTNKKIRLAILGNGPRGTGLGGVYAQHPNVEVVAVCDIADGLAENASQHLNNCVGYTPKAYTSYEQLSKNAAYDAILIAVDPDIQVDYAVREMERGIHVMTEVPAAYTMDQCYTLVNAVRKTGCKYQFAEQTRYWSFIKKWREMAQAGAFGRIYYAEGEYLHYEPKWDYFRHKKTGHHVWTDDPSYDQNPDYERTWRYYTFANPIFYLPHELSPLLSVTGGRIESVSCLGTKQGESYTKGFDVRDLECALMHNSNGAIFSLRAGFNAPYGFKRETGAHWYQIKGTEKSVEWARSELDCPKEFIPGQGWVEHTDWTCADAEAPEAFKNAPHGGADLYPIHYFIDAILNDKTPPMDVYHAVETAAPAILAAESANRGGILLQVPDFRI